MIKTANALVAFQNIPCIYCTVATHKKSCSNCDNPPDLLKSDKFWPKLLYKFLASASAGASELASNSLVEEVWCTLIDNRPMYHTIRAKITDKDQGFSLLLKG